jgi:hypothetical protein
MPTLCVHYAYMYVLNDQERLSMLIFGQSSV